MEKLKVPSEFISISEAARRLHVSRQTVYVWLHKGKLTWYEVGGEARILNAEVERILAGRAT